MGSAMHLLSIIQGGSTALSLHLVTASLALLLGFCILLQKKGTKRHRISGYAWIALMFVGIATSFFITIKNPGHYSSTHVYSVLFFFTVSLGLWCRLKGFGIAHAVLMGGTYVWSGALTMINFFPFHYVQEALFRLF